MLLCLCEFIVNRTYSGNLSELFENIMTGPFVSADTFIQSLSSTLPILLLLGPFIHFLIRLCCIRQKIITLVDDEVAEISFFFFFIPAAFFFRRKD